ncbi:DoxX family protein [Lichenicola sp.]|uniref:DoxX family protein n=1 Tax=Lichenicola sp. TaxID=2804529 RepID=UPI003AFFBC6F
MTSLLRKRAAPSLWHTLVGLAFASAGIAKLAPMEAEAALFKSWGWTRNDMQIMGATELLGAALLVTRSTQKLGALLLSGTSVCLLTAELKHKNDMLVTPRAGLLAAAMTGFIGGR